MKRLIRCSEIGNYVFSSSEPPSLAAKEVETALGDLNPSILGLDEIYREYCPEGFSGRYSPGGGRILEEVEQGRLLLINEAQISNSSFGGFHKYQKQKETLPIQTIKARPREEPLTLADAMPNDSLTVYLGGAGMAGSYIDDQVNNLNRAAIKNSWPGTLAKGCL